MSWPNIIGLRIRASIVGYRRCLEPRIAAARGLILLAERYGCCAAARAHHACLKRRMGCAAPILYIDAPRDLRRDICSLIDAREYISAAMANERGRRFRRRADIAP